MDQHTESEFSNCSSAHPVYLMSPTIEQHTESIWCLQLLVSTPSPLGFSNCLMTPTVDQHTDCLISPIVDRHTECVWFLQLLIITPSLSDFSNCWSAHRAYLISRARDRCIAFCCCSILESLICSLRVKPKTILRHYCNTSMLHWVVISAHPPHPTRNGQTPTPATNMAEQKLMVANYWPYI